MKKTISILLAIIILTTICTGCANDTEEPLVVPIHPTTIDTEPTNPPDAFPTESTEAITSNTDKNEDINNQYSLLAAVHMGGENPQTTEKRFDEALLNEDVTTLNNMVGKMSQTLVILPHKNEYEYDADKETISVLAKNNDTVELHLTTNTEKYIGDEKNLIEQDTLKYAGHSGVLYACYEKETIQFIYMGSTESKAAIVAIGDNKTMLTNILNAVIIYESSHSTATDITAYTNSIHANKQAVVYADKYQTILCFDAADKYKCKTGDGYFELFDNNNECYCHVEAYDPSYVADEASWDILDFYELNQETKYIETNNLFGFTVAEDEENIFYGFDKNSYGAILIESTLPIDSLFEIIKAIDVKKCAYSNETIMKIRQNSDEALASMLKNAFLLALADADGWEELNDYVCDGNVSSYVSTCADLDAAKIAFNCTHNHYYYDDSARQEEGMYSVAGNMRGVTFTFYPIEEKGEYYYKLADGVINEFVRPHHITQGREDIPVVYNGDTPDYENHGTISTMISPSGYYCILNSLRVLAGDRFAIASTAYQNVPLTIFVTYEPYTTAPNNPIQAYYQFGGLCTD